MAYLAVLAYPGSEKTAHAHRDRLIDAICDWITGWKRRQHRYQRVSARRAATTTDTWIRRRQSLKNDAVFRALNRAEKIIIERRLTAARLAEHLAGIFAARAFDQPNSRFRLRVLGPQSLTRAMDYLAGQTRTGDASTLWRIWRESLPVLHLACAFDKCQPKRRVGDRPDLIIRCVRDHQLWLADAIRSSENRALMLPLYTNFSARAHVSLVAI